MSAPNGSRAEPQPSYRFLEHTGEVEVELEAPEAAGLFAAAAQAIGELLNDGVPPAGQTAATASISLSAPARDRLLVDFIEELVFLAEREGMVPAGASVELRDSSLAGEVRFVDRQPLPLVKGATLHNLIYVEEPDGARARVVLDV